MNIDTEYRNFIDKYPTYINLIESYERAEGNGIKFNLTNGKAAYYYPLNVDNTKSHGTKNK